MQNIVKDLLMSIGAGAILYSLQQLIGSNYLNVFLKQNLIMMLVMLMAINSATMGIVLTKIRDILDKVGDKHTFKCTKNEMNMSIVEQIVIIIVSTLLLILQDSKLLLSCTHIINTLLISCFVYALNILYDATKSILCLLDYGMEN